MQNKTFNKVKQYIEMEYWENLSKKMQEPKFLSVSAGYINNCISLNKTVPYIAQGIVKLLKKTK